MRKAERLIRKLDPTILNQVLKHATLLCNRAAAHLRCPGADAASSCAEDAEAAAMRTNGSSSSSSSSSGKRQ